MPKYPVTFFNKPYYAIVAGLMIIFIALSACSSTPESGNDTSAEADLPVASFSTPTPTNTATATVSPQTPTVTPTQTATTPPQTATVTSTNSLTATVETAEASVTPTQENEASASAETTAATPTTAPQADGLLPAPEPLSPDDGIVYSGLFEGTPIVLKWQPAKPALSLDELYLITINYRHQGQTFTDYAWTQQTNWLVNEHDYLAQLSEDGLFRWSVKLIRQTETSEDGVPQGPALSQSSVERSFVWQPAPSGGGDFGSGNNNDDNDDDDDGGDDDNDDGGNGGGGYP